MRSRAIFLALLPVGALFFIFPLFAAGEDEGAKVYSDVCTACHSTTTRPLEDKHLTREQWRQTVVRMNGFGRQVPDAKLPALLDYLVRMHPPPARGTAASPGAAHQGGPAVSGVAAAGDPGAAIYEDYCTSCHNAKTRPLDDTRLTRPQWKAAIDKMIGMGTALSSDEIPPLLDWLTRTHGAPEPPGK